jgi:hypothetical protein
MFALKARAPASLAASRRHASSSSSSRRNSSQIVRVAEFERKTTGKAPPISVPAVDGGKTPLSILNDGADAFAELVALNKPKQSVNRPQKVRVAGRGDGDWRRERENGSAESDGEMRNRMARWHAMLLMMRATKKKPHPFRTRALRSPPFKTPNRRSTSARTRRSRTATRPRPRSTRRWSTRGPGRCCG